MITTIFTYNAANELIKVCTHIVQYLPKSDIANNKDYFYGLQRMKIIVFIVIIFSKSNIAYAQNNGSNLGLRFVNFNNEFKQTNNYKILNSKLDSLNNEDFASYAIRNYFKNVVPFLIYSGDERVFNTFNSRQIDSVLNQPFHQIENIKKIYQLIEYKSYFLNESVNVRLYSFFEDKSQVDDYKFRFIFILKNNLISSMLVSIISFEVLPNEVAEINEKKILFNTVDDNKLFNYYSIEIDENGYLYNETIN